MGAPARVHKQSLDDIRSKVVPRLSAEEIDPLAPLLAGLDRAVVIDAGACVGAWSRAWLDRFAASTSRMFLFEPQPEARIHRDHLDFFSSAELGKIEIVPMALARNSGTRQFYTDDPGSSLASLYPGRAAGWGFKTTRVSVVEAVSLDDLAASRQLSRVDVLKLDVEGAEYEVLAGASRLIADQAIRLILFEFGAPHVHSRTFFHDIWQLLAAADYRIARLSETNSLEFLPEYSYDLERFDLVRMFVAFPASHDVKADAATGHERT